MFALVVVLRCHTGRRRGALDVGERLGSNLRPVAVGSSRCRRGAGTLRRLARDPGVTGGRGRGGRVAVAVGHALEWWRFDLGPG